MKNCWQYMWLWVINSNVSHRKRGICQMSETQISIFPVFWLKKKFRSQTSRLVSNCCLLCGWGRWEDGGYVWTRIEFSCQDTRTVMLASWAIWQLAMTVCYNDMNLCTLCRVKRDRAWRGMTVGEVHKGDRSQLKLWEGNEFLSGPQAANTPTTLLS